MSKKNHRGETEKYVAPKKEKNEYTHTEVKHAEKQSFWFGVIAVCVLQVVAVLGYNRAVGSIENKRDVSTNIAKNIYIATAQAIDNRLAEKTN
jgi:hypothetical protein